MYVLNNFINIHYVTYFLNLIHGLKKENIRVFILARIPKPLFSPVLSAQLLNKKVVIIIKQLKTRKTDQFILLIGKIIRFQTNSM